MEMKEQIKKVGLFGLYFVIIFITIYCSFAEEIPSVQLEDTSGISYLNIFNYNTSVHNNLTGLQGGSPNEYYHLNYAEYNFVQTELGNASLDLSSFNLQEGYIYVGNSSNNPGGESSQDFISGFNIGNFTDWDKDYYDLINRPTKFGNTTEEIFDVVDNGTFLKTETDPIWTADKSDYSTTPEIIAFGYYNESSFIITDYFTKTDILNFGYYNLSNFDINDYITSAQVLGFNYYNASNFDINDYITSAQVLGFNYYNASDFDINDYITSAQVLGFNYYNASNFDINDYITSAQVLGFNYYNASDFDISDYATNIKVDSIGNWSADKNYYWNTSNDLNVGINITTSKWFNGKFNWTTDNWNSFDGNLLDFNESKLETTYFNASSIQVITGTGSGTLTGIQGKDGITYNVTEIASDYELRVNFTGITEMTTLLIRHKCSDDAGHISAIQVWNYDTSNWDGFGYLTESTTSEIKTLGFYDGDSYVNNGTVQVRFYQSEVGNFEHIHQFDWVGLSKGFGTPVGQEIDPIWSSDKSDYFTSSDILGFGYYNLSDFNIADYVLSSVLLSYGYYNLSDFNIADYSTKAESDLLYAPVTYGDEWNKTYADTLYTNETDTDTNLTEDNVEEYIFDGDNTANLQMTTFNITMGDAVLYTNSTCFVVKMNETYLEVCE